MTTNLDNLLQSIQAEFRRNQIESPLLLKKVERALTDVGVELSAAFASRVAHHPAINAIGGYGNSMSAAAAHICTSQLISATKAFAPLRNALVLPRFYGGILRNPQFGYFGRLPPAREMTTAHERRDEVQERTLPSAGA